VGSETGQQEMRHGEIGALAAARCGGLEATTGGPPQSPAARERNPLQNNLRRWPGALATVERSRVGWQGPWGGLADRRAGAEALWWAASKRGEIPARAVISGNGGAIERFRTGAAAETGRVQPAWRLSQALRSSGP
jgi:hypothetical protein